MMRRRRAVLLGLACAALAAVGLVVAAGGDRGLTAGPMIQLLDDQGCTLVWRAADDGPYTVEVLPADQGPTRRVDATGVEGRFEVRLDGLTPGQRHAYRIRRHGAAEPLAAGSVRPLADVRGTTFQFLAFGDSGTGHGPQHRLAEKMAAYAPDVIIHTGDVMQDDGSPGGYDHQFFDPYAELLPHAAFYPCQGNHDYYYDHRGQPWLDVFVLPTNGPAGATPESHYFTDIGGVRFVVLNSNAPYAELRDHVVAWLDQTLSSAGDRWTIMVFHHPLYTNGRHSPPGKFLHLIVPLIDRHRVELVLNGHNHMYERSHPIRDGRIAPTGQGTVYVTTAGGGGNLQPIEKPNPPFLVMQDNSQFSFTVVDVTGDALRVRQIGQDGRPIDGFEVPRRSPATAPAPAAGQ